MSNRDVEAVAGVIGSIYEAAYDRSRWDTAMTGVRDLLGGSKACMSRIGPDLDPSDCVTSPGDPIFMQTYVDLADAYEIIDPGPLTRAIMGARVGAVYRDQAVVGEALRKSRFWNEWMAPQDMYGGLSCKLIVSEPSLWLFDVQRGRRQDPWRGEDVALVETLTPHVTRAVEMGRRFQTASATQLGFSHLPFGIILVNADQRILDMNGAALTLLARAEGLIQDRRGRLVVVDPHAAAAMARHVLDACRGGRNGIPGGGGDLLLRSHLDDCGSDGLALSVGPLINPESVGMPLEPCAVVMIRELDLGLAPGYEPQLRSLFGLTASEAKLAGALASGLGLREAAEQQRLRFSTARTYLERIFQKTGTNAQGSLVALIRLTQPIRRPV
ncbi:MAG: helix-turn-helix transcriptional regulator [Rhizobiaceae bacterium]|nr:helix-turn-helix transcriptional regulator [Rhizobiaceae bacterium]